MFLFHSLLVCCLGEASASTMWDNNAWVYFYNNNTEGEPPFLIQDFIHALQPDARFIVMLRDPVERWAVSLSSMLYTRWIRVLTHILHPVCIHHYILCCRHRQVLSLLTAKKPVVTEDLLLFTQTSDKFCYDSFEVHGDLMFECHLNGILLKLGVFYAINVNFYLRECLNMLL